MHKNQEEAAWLGPRLFSAEGPWKEKKSKTTTKKHPNTHKVTTFSEVTPFCISFMVSTSLPRSAEDIDKGER